MSVQPHLIADDASTPQRTFQSREPARPDHVVGEYALGEAADVNRAVQVAEDARTDWSGRSLLDRGEIVRRAGLAMREQVGELAQLLAREVGKPVTESEAEIQRAAVTCDYVAGQARLPEGELYASDGPAKLAIAYRRPLGVVAIITPWNFPLGLPLWKLAPALLYGNVVVWKPSEHAPATATALHALWLEAGLPAQALGVVFGGAEAGGALVAHDSVGAVSFTGSTAVGRGIAGVVAQRGARIQLELGGKNAVLVLADADLELATRLIVQGATSYAGQKCSATSRVVVVEELYAELRERLVSAFSALRVGDPLSREVDVGPLIDAAAVERAERYLAAAAQAGATRLVGGEQLQGAGHFMTPALLSEVSPHSALAREEVFAPVLAMIPAPSLDSAVEIVNATDYGFFTTICSERTDTLLELAPRIESGIVKLNTVTTAADPHLPFGGWKASGNSTPEQGLAAREFFTRSQALYLA